MGLPPSLSPLSLSMSVCLCLSLSLSLSLSFSLSLSLSLSLPASLSINTHIYESKLTCCEHRTVRKIFNLLPVVNTFFLGVGGWGGGFKFISCLAAFRDRFWTWDVFHVLSHCANVMVLILKLITCKGGTASTVPANGTLAVISSSPARVYSSKCSLFKA